MSTECRSSNKPKFATEPRCLVWYLHEVSWKGKIAKGLWGRDRGDPPNNATGYGKLERCLALTIAMVAVKYVPELDGIRALAVWIVMLFHAGVPLMEGGWVGVDVFFVLSGFLVTTLLLAEEERHHRVSLGSFWMRRMLRLLPAYYLYLLPITIFFVSTVSFDGAHGDWTATSFLLSLWAYFSNFAPQGGLWEYQFLVRHLWSLAVEQQFYLLLCLLYLLARRIGVSLATCLLGFLILASIVSHAGILPGVEKLSLFGRGISLIIGCIVAYYSPKLVLVMQSRALTVLHIFGICGALVLILATLYRSQFTAMEEFGRVTLISLSLYTTLAIATAGFWYGWSEFGSAILRNRILVSAGKISYGIYVYHMAVWGLIFQVLVEYLEPSSSIYVNFGLKLIIYFIITHLIAAISYRYVERRFLMMKRREG